MLGLILKVVIILAIISIVAIIANKVEDKNRSYMSFRESIALADLPVVTFYQGDKRLNFLLDTGATLSVIDEKLVNSIESKFNDTISRTIGVDGKVMDNLINVDISFKYKDKDFSDTFQVVDMTQTFNSIKTSTGVTIHGIIGSCFMQKYKYVLDFKEMIAYSKK